MRITHEQHHNILTLLMGLGGTFQLLRLILVRQVQDLCRFRNHLLYKPIDGSEAHDPLRLSNQLGAALRQPIGITWTNAYANDHTCSFLKKSSESKGAAFGKYRWMYEACRFR